jgi:transmembrane sensor
METAEFKELLNRYREGKATTGEVAWLESWYMDLGKADKVVMDEAELIETRELIWKQFAAAHQIVPIKRQLWPRIAVAAAAVAAIVVGVWFFNSESGVLKQVQDDEVVKNDIAPGKNGATIKLANGKVIQLSDAKSGVVIGNGRIAYSSSPLHDEVASIPRNDVMQLTASTAKGQTYQFTLPDGTKVWLNADSKLEFPSSFVDSKTRFVKLSGEGYFEVAKDKAHPFIVETDDKEKVEVLGTHFNISSYKDNGTITSLLEGSVKLTNDVEARILKPGERGMGTIKGIMLVPGDVNDAVAWKNGYFRFRGEQIQPIMEQLARWYDIDISYQGKMPEDGFNGKVSRNKNISQVLKALEAMKIVHFKVEGRRVTVIN